MRFSRYGAAVVTGSLVLSSLALAVSHGSAASLTPVKYAYDFPGPDFELIPLIVAQDRGYFANEGIKVAVEFPSDTSSTVKFLATGSANIGFITTTDMAVAVAADAPIVSVGNYSMSNNWALFAKPGVQLTAKNLKKDLEGKTIFSYGDTWTESMLPFVLKYAGLSQSQVKIVTDPTGNDLTDLLAGKVDVSTSTTNYEIAGFDTSGAKGKEVTLLGTAVGAPNIPVWVYATSKSYASKNAKQVKAFMAGIAKGTAWAVAHPSQAAADFDKAYPQKVSGYSNAYNLVGWEQTIPFLKNSAGQYFTQTSAQWTTLDKAMKSIKLISSVPSPSVYYTNKFLPTS